MLNATLEKKLAPKPADRSPLIPPDEKFWIRYSPQGEAPLSGVASVTLHLLILGMLVIGVFMLGAFWPGATKSLPVEPVVFGEAGGGGSTTGQGDGPGGPRPQPEDAASGDQPGKGHDRINPDDRPNLNPIDVARLKDENFSPEDIREIFNGPKPMGAFYRLDKDVRDSWLSGVNPNPGKGQGGDGSGGGKGIGVGKSPGPGTGDGKLRNERENRMLRWSMIFDTTSGNDYLAQLRELDAILAIPVGPNHYKVAHKLVPPVHFADEDLSKLDRIWWIDENPKSVSDLGTAMRLPGPFPPRVIAFIPPELEKDLAEKELAFKGLSVDQIFETKFRVEKAGGKYVVKVFEQKAK